MAIYDYDKINANRLWYISFVSQTGKLSPWAIYWSPGATIQWT